MIHMIYADEYGVLLRLHEVTKNVLQGMKSRILQTLLATEVGKWFAAGYGTGFFWGGFHSDL